MLPSARPRSAAPPPGGTEAADRKHLEEIDVSQSYRPHTVDSAALIVSAIHPAHAQSNAAANYPNKPIRVIVGFGAGGGNDIFARLVGQKMTEKLGQNVVIENKPGAGGRLAADFTAKQPADGYTIMVGASGMMSIASAIYPKLAYHPTKSFAPLSMTANFPLILVVAADHPAKSRNSLNGQGHPARPITPRRRRPSLLPANCELKTGMPGVAPKEQQ